MIIDLFIPNLLMFIFYYFIDVFNTPSIPYSYYKSQGKITLIKEVIEIDKYV